ncbi:MAG: D-alanyl-D-alanine carboxypeptidase/D-alanyl-D-alanine endopeptidase [Gammaproteobacteria bacterium]
MPAQTPNQTAQQLRRFQPRLSAAANAQKRRGAVLQHWRKIPQALRQILARTILPHLRRGLPQKFSPVFSRALRLLLCLLLLPPVAGAEGLPPDVRALMKKHRISPARAGIVIKRAGGEVLLSHQTDKIFNPASLAKLPLVFAAFDILGPAHKWRTVFARAGEIQDGVLRGDLIIAGGGDPYITTERFLSFVGNLRSRGIHTIEGDLIIDDTFFQFMPHDRAAFDGAAFKTYNAGGGALVVNWGAQRVAFLPEKNGVRIYADPPNDNFIIDGKKVRAGKTRCRNWRGRIIERYRGDGLQMTLALRGKYSPRCGEQSFNTSALDHAANAAGVFGAMWRNLGGVWNGKWKTAPRPPQAKDIAVFESPALAVIAAAMNKYSNNIMARNMFVSLSMQNGAPPHTEGAAREVFNRWMRAQNIQGEFFMDNGSGLSRKGRMSAGQLAALMEGVLAHPMRAEITSSLPILGVDGTLRKRLRKTAAGAGHLKTGSLRGVKNIAGFLRGAGGEDIIFICMLEKSGARAKPFQDALMKWALRQKGL